MVSSALLLPHTLDLLPTMIPTPTLIAVAASLLIGLATGWTANGWRLNGRIDQMIARHSLDLSKATEAAMVESTRLQKQKDDALNEANKIAQNNASAAANARSELDRVRKQLASSVTIGSATCPSTRNYAETLAVIFGECATRLFEMAKEADGHALDSRTYQQAFPR
jgi:hypothetical protein